ncbi:MAG TPA: S10 family peptidase [Cyclobacteriaceae bacterium]
MQSKHFFIYLLTFFSCVFLNAQHRKIPSDTTVITSHSVTIKGQRIDYTATTGTQPVWDEDGMPMATLFYTYYQRKNIVDLSKRPLLISFNGGPGSASVWMHIAYTGPKILNIDDEGYPIQPYGIKDNPYSVLDAADIVFVNPVNTAYSRTITKADEKVDREKFFGINADIKYLADWLNTFVSRHNRWLSPKYLIGESYGGTRVAGLALELQQRQWMYLNGVIMVSPADYKIYESDQPLAALNLPYFTAAAWYHKMLPDELQQKDLLEILPESEAYAINNFMPALARGGSLDQKEKETIAEKLAYYSGLSKKTILRNNLNVSTSYFWKDLLRDKSGQTIGRLDSRYTGLDKMVAGENTDYNAEITSWLHAFTPAINYYTKNYLKFETDIKYNMFGPVRPWDRSENNTRENLRLAMAQNPFLNILVQSGYFDGATNYFEAKYTLWQLDPSGKMQDRMRFKGYRSGHMMYLRKEDLQTANQDLRNFILESIPRKPAKYD